MEKVREKLQSFCDDQLAEWYRKSESQQNDFLKEIIAYAELHSGEIYQIALSNKYDEDSIHSVIYKALSQQPKRHFSFLKGELFRLTEALLRNQIDADTYEDIVWEVDLEAIYFDSFDEFRDLTDGLIGFLRATNSRETNQVLISFVEDCILEIDKEVKKNEFFEIQNRLKHIAANLDSDSRREIVEIFEDYSEAKFSPNIYNLKLFTVIAILLIAIICYYNLITNQALKGFNPKRLTYYFFGSGFLIACFFYNIFSVIKNQFLRLVFSLLVFGPIAIKGILYCFENGFLKSVEIWLNSR